MNNATTFAHGVGGGEVWVTGFKDGRFDRAMDPADGPLIAKSNVKWRGSGLKPPIDGHTPAAEDGVIRAAGNFTVMVTQANMLEELRGFSMEGLTWDGGSQLTLQDANCSGVRQCVALSRGVDGFKIDLLKCDGIRTDCVFIGSDARNGVVSNVLVTNSRPVPGDHADAVQLTPSGATRPTYNILVDRLTFVRGSGDKMQGAFAGDESGRGYQSLRFINSCIVGGWDNGLMIVNGDQASSITKSYVTGLPDQRSSIYRTGRVKVTGNWANAYKFTPVDPSNKIVPRALTDAAGLFFAAASWSRSATPLP